MMPLERDCRMKKQRQTKIVNTISENEITGKYWNTEIKIEKWNDRKYYYKPVRIGNTFRNNYIEYESSGDKTKHHQSINISNQFYVF